MVGELEPLSTSFAVYAFVVVLGLLWGSFANVCIYRWPPSEQFPRGRSVVRPGSHCFACQTPVRWYDNVPIASWLWLRGKCRACGVAFSPRYLIVEAVTGALFGVAWHLTVVMLAGFEPFDVRLVKFVVHAAFCVVMVVITFIDLDHKLILNKVTIPSIIAFYLLGVILLHRDWSDGLIGIVVGYGLPWAIGELYYRVTGREGLGLGDGMLLALIGALLGWRGVVISLFGGSVIGSVIGVAVLALARRSGAEAEAEAAEPAEAARPAEPGAPEAPAESAESRSIMRTELPFGPFLAIAAVFYLFAEPWLQLHFHLPGG